MHKTKIFMQHIIDDYWFVEARTIEVSPATNLEDCILTWCMDNLDEVDGLVDKREAIVLEYLDGCWQFTTV